jgi:TRAP-type C4-dicarboxylate transport system substrate-binding protein
MGGCFSVLAAQAAEVTLKTITALPRKHSSNEPFDHMTKLATEYSKGQLKFNYLGGGDVIPVQEQWKSIANGVVDISYAPASYYLGEVPEAQALNGANIHASELRKRGGIEALNKAFEKRLQAHLLGYMGSGYPMYVYLREKPKLDTNGLPDLRGLKIRGAPAYRRFLSELGASTVLIHVGEMYTALERGVIDGIGWISTGVTDFRWDKFLKYRITPSYWQGDIVVIINQKRWASLNQAQRKALTDAAKETESYAHDYFAKLGKREYEKLSKGGMTTIQLGNAAAQQYRYLAHDVGVWQAMEGNVPENTVKELKEKFYQPK